MVFTWRFYWWNVLLSFFTKLIWCFIKFCQPSKPSESRKCNFSTWWVRQPKLQNVPKSILECTISWRIWEGIFPGKSVYITRKSVMKILDQKTVVLMFLFIFWKIYFLCLRYNYIIKDQIKWLERIKIFFTIEVLSWDLKFRRFIIRSYIQFLSYLEYKSW